MTPLQTWGHLDHWGMSSSFQHSKKPVPHWGSKEQKFQAQCLCFPRSRGPQPASLLGLCSVCKRAVGREQRQQAWGRRTAAPEAGRPDATESCVPTPHR